MVHHNLFIVRKITLSHTVKKETREKRNMPESNAVLVGNKPTMNYVLACITLFHSGSKEVNIKARGRSISHAIDIAEVVRRRFLPDVKVKKVSIGTDQLQAREENGQVTNVSTIEITLQR
jgi:DNA-binding protein